MEFVLKPSNRDATDQDLLDDIKKVVKELNADTITRDEYDEKGRYSQVTIRRRFGGWLNALSKAGLPETRNFKVNNNDLIKNIEDVWLKLGRQPNAVEMISPLSKYTRQTYRRRFGSFQKGLEAFIEYIHTADDDNEEPIVEVKIQETEKVFKHNTKRNPTDRLKVQVLMRDGNKCRLCGITLTGDNIHFDHILAWSKGGETTLENIQILCKPHNLAKGNV